MIFFFFKKGYRFLWRQVHQHFGRYYFSPQKVLMLDFFRYARGISGMWVNWVIFQVGNLDKHMYP